MRFTATLGALSVVVQFVATASAASGDWPSWRGPKRDGISTEKGLVAEWPKEGPPLAWKATGLGEGFATVAVAGGRIFTTGHTNGEEMVHALASEDGKVVWSSSIGPAAKVSYPGSRAVPTVDGEKVFALAVSGNLACLETATGKILWQKQLQQELGGTRPGWGYTESPLVEGKLVLCTPGGRQGTVVAFDTATGELAWRSKEFTDPAHYSSLIPADIGGVRQVIQLTPRSVAGIAMADGRLLWKAARPNDTPAVIPTPVQSANVVYVTSGYGAGCNAFAISKDSAGFKAEEKYGNKEMVNHHGGVILLDGFVYGHSQTEEWVCQNLATGDLMWRHDGVGKGSIAYADGRFYLRSEERRRSQVAIIEATTDSYRERGRFTPPNQSGRETWAHPVIAGGRLYLRDQEILLCYDIRRK